MAISLGDIKKKKIKVSPIENNSNLNKTYNPAPFVSDKTFNKSNEKRTYNLGEIRENNITVTPLSKKKSKVMVPSSEETMMKNNINNQITTNISNKIVTGGYENEIHNRNMSQATKTSISNPIVFGSKKENNSTPVDTSDFIYNDTGKKYGDYYYDNYELYKDMPIYEQHGKYYLKTNKGYEELGRLDKNGNVTKNVMTTKEAEKEELEKAKKLGFKDNNLKITSQDYDDAQDTFKELQKQYKLSDKELNNWIKTGDLDVSHISMQTNKMNSLKQKAEDYRTKINSGEIKQYEQKFDTTNQIYMDTHDMSDDEKQHYISTVTGKKDPTLKDNRTFFKTPEVFKDGYDRGDIVRSTGNTLGDIASSFVRGTMGTGEGIIDTVQNLGGSAVEKFGEAINDKKKDVKTFHNNTWNYGYKFGNKNYWYDEKNNKLYDDDWNRVYNFDLNKLQKRYTYENDIAEFGRSWKESTNVNATDRFMKEVLHEDSFKDNSVFGDKSRAIIESLGQAVPIMAAGGGVGAIYGEGSAVATTSGLTFASTYGNAKTEAIRNGATEDEAIKSAFIQASAETISEQFFDSIPGAKSAGWGEKLVGKVGNSVEKYMGSKTSKIVMKTLDISGEGFEEIISNMLTAGGNDIVHFIDKDFNYGMENQSGNILDDMTKAMTSQDSMDSFISALLTSAILNAGSSKINSSKRNQVINEIVRTYAEENNISFKEAKSRLKVDGDNVEFNESVNTSNLPNNSTVEQRNINNNINNQINENIENSMARAQNNNISNKSDIPLMKEDFVKQVDSYLNKTFPSNQLFNLGETPEILQKIGLKNNPITMKQSALNHIIADGSPDSHLHNISIENIKRLPEAISSPLNVLYSNSSTKGDSVVVITDLADNSERPIIVSILIDDNGRIGNIDFITNSLTSAYGKRDYDDYMKREIEKGNMLYDIDEGIKKELAQTRVQFPTSPNSLNEQVIPTDKIENQSVNRFVEQPVSNNDNTTNFSKSQIAPLPQYNMQQKTKNDTTKVKPPIAQKYQKNTIDEKIEKSNTPDVLEFKTKQIAPIVENKINRKIEKSSKDSIVNATKVVKKGLDLSSKEKQSFKEKLKKYENKTYDEVVNGKTYNEIRDIIKEYSARPIENIDEEMKSVKSEIKNRSIKIDDNLKAQITDYNDFRKSMFGKLKLSNEGISIDSLYNELSNSYPYYFDSNVNTEVDMLYELADFMNKDVVDTQYYYLTNTEIERYTAKVFNELKNGLITEEQIQEIRDGIVSKKNTISRQDVKNYLLNKTGLTIKDIQVGKDINKIDMNRTDPIRVNEKVFGYKVGKKINEAIFYVVKHNEADRQRWLNVERDDIKKLGIKPRSKESAAVQKYGEKMGVNIFGEVVEYGDKQLANEFPDIKTQEKIKYAAKVLRHKYDIYIDQINNVLEEMGYDPIKKRKDYFRHFQALEDVFSRYGLPVSKETLKEDLLPTDINGLTDEFKPGKQWFANAMKRTGMKTTFDAITGIDGYLEGASNLIFHTEDIQRYRAFSDFIRNTYGETNGFNNLEHLTEEEVAQRIEDIQSNKLSKYVAWLDEQANALANKKGRIDRAIESLADRKVYNILNAAKQQVGSNMTGLNIRSAITNFASAVQGASKTNKLSFLKGTLSTINNIFHKDTLIDQSDFLTSRLNNSQSIAKKPWQKARDAGQIFMNGTDWFTSNQIWRSKYFENISNGMSKEEAIHYADDFAARIMGDRSKGATAQIFNSKTLGILTQFQLEVNNQWSSLIHDNKMDIKSKNKTIGGVMFQTGQLFGLSYLFNVMAKSLTGKDVMLDPLEMIFKLLGWSDEDKDKTWEERTQDVLDNIVDNLPFANLITPVTGLGSGGRIPISEAFRGFKSISGIALGTEKDDYGNKLSRMDSLQNILGSVWYWVFPTGYGQVRKTTKGLSMFSDDKEIKGSYTKKGNLRFPVKDTIGNRVQAGLFGEYASKEAREYFNQGRKPLSDSQLKEYKTLNIPISDYWVITKDLSSLKEKLKGKKTDERKKTLYKYIDDLDISQVRKDILKKSEYKTYTDGDNRIIKYINNSNMSKKSKDEILKKLGLDK